MTAKRAAKRAAKTAAKRAAKRAAMTAAKRAAMTAAKTRVTAAARRATPAAAALRAGATAALLVVLGGGGAGCNTVALGDPPAELNSCRPSQAFFRDEILCNFLLKDYNGKRCGDPGGCHNAASGRQLKVVMPQGATCPAPDPPVVSTPFAVGSDWEALYISASNQLRCNNVRGSDLYTRPTQIRDHGGGMLIDPDGPEALLLDAWVMQP